MYSKDVFENLINKYKNNYDIENNALIELENSLEELRIELELFSAPFEGFDLKHIQSITEEKEAQAKEIEENIEKQKQKVALQKSLFNNLLELYKMNFGTTSNFNSIK